MGILLYITLVNNRQNIIDNWPLHRCNPIVMPFASLFGKDTAENFQGCMFQSSEGFFGTLIQPFQFIMSLFVKIIGDMFQQLNVLRNFLEPVRQFVGFASSMVFQKVEGVMNVVIYSFLKINNLLKRVFANFRLAVYSLEASQMAINSTWNGPIGGLVRQWGPVVDFFCFAEGTDVNGTPIESLEIGDNILGTLVFKAPNKLYNYKGVLVSGNHFVLHNGHWTMVKKTGASQVDYMGERLYSVITRDHLFEFNGITWADYEETDRLTGFQKDIAIHSLTGSEPTERKASREPNLILGGTPVLMKDRQWVDIQNIQLGDRVFPDNEVIGLVRLATQIHHHGGVGIDNIVWRPAGWTTVGSATSQHDTFNGVAYNIITNQGYFIARDHIVRDYIEFGSLDIYEKLSDITHLVLGGV